MNFIKYETVYSNNISLIVKYTDFEKSKNAWYYNYRYYMKKHNYEGNYVTINETIDDIIDLQLRIEQSKCLINNFVGKHKQVNEFVIDEKYYCIIRNYEKFSIVDLVVFSECNESVMYIIGDFMNNNPNEIKDLNKFLDNSKIIKPYLQYCTGFIAWLIENNDIITFNKIMRIDNTTSLLLPMKEKIKSIMNVSLRNKVGDVSKHLMSDFNGIIQMQMCICLIVKEIKTKNFPYELLRINYLHQTQNQLFSNIISILIIKKLISIEYYSNKINHKILLERIDSYNSFSYSRDTYSFSSSTINFPLKFNICHESYTSLQKNIPLVIRLFKEIVNRNYYDKTNVNELISSLMKHLACSFKWINGYGIYDYNEILKFCIKRECIINGKKTYKLLLGFFTELVRRRININKLNNEKFLMLFPFVKNLEVIKYSNTKELIKEIIRQFIELFKPSIDKFLNCWNEKIIIVRYKDKIVIKENIWN